MPQRGVFVAVGEGGRRISSRDGRQWKNDTRWAVGAADADEALHDIAFGLRRFIAVGGGAAKGRIVSTRDGKTWRELPAPRGCVETIVFGGGRFIAGHGGELLWSEDGENSSPVPNSNGRARPAPSARRGATARAGTGA